MRRSPRLMDSYVAIVRDSAVMRGLFYPPPVRYSFCAWSRRRCSSSFCRAYVAASSAAVVRKIVPAMGFLGWAARCSLRNSRYRCS